MERFDYVVVGAGSAGCVLGARLTEDADVKVLLLEAGPPDKKMEIHVPAAFTKLFKTEFDWNYTTEKQPQLNGRSLYWPRGKTLGGSSSINAQMYVPGRPADFDEWAKLGATNWDWASLRPYFERSALVVSDLRDPNPLTEVFLQAVQSVGLSRAEDPNTAVNAAAQVRVTQKHGRRFSAADAYLRPARSRPNLVIRTQAQAGRVIFDGRSARGVEYRWRGEFHRAEARREVVLCGGAVNSPQLLLLSGVGPADELEKHGIPPVVNLPGVGANLQDHLAAAVTVRCRKALTLVSAESPANLLRYLVFKRGMLSSNVAEAAAFLNTTPDLSRPDLELLWLVFPVIDHTQVRPDGHGVTIMAIGLRPLSRGRITLRSSDPFQPPSINPRYLTDAGGEDLRVIVDGVQWAQRIFASEPFAGYVGEPVEPDCWMETRSGIEEFVRAQAETLYHPVGTCRMGSDNAAVVDPDLKVRGVDRLRVVDAAVMPTLPRAHPHPAVVAIAERAADIIRGLAPRYSDTLGHPGAPNT